MQCPSSNALGLACPNLLKPSSGTRVGAGRREDWRSLPRDLPQADVGIVFEDHIAECPGRALDIEGLPSISCAHILIWRTVAIRVFLKTKVAPSVHDKLAITVRVIDDRPVAAV